VLLVGGKDEKGKIHRNIVFVDSGSTLTHPFSDYQCYSACSTGDGLIVSGGYDTSTRRSLSTVKIFSLKTQQWTDLPDLSLAKHLHGSVYVNNRYYTVGGDYTEKGSIKRIYDAIEVLDLTSSQSSAFSSLPVPVRYPGVAHVNNTLLVFGGYAEKRGWLRDTYSYDMTTRERRTCQQMPFTDHFLRSTVVVDKHVFLLYHDKFLQYYVVRDTWTKLTGPTKPSSTPAMVLHENSLLVLGGYDGGATSRIQSYDPQAKKWSVERRTMPVALREHWALVVKMPKSK
jgi:hypothetical protein